jgi:hypothetical protein
VSINGKDLDKSTIIEDLEKIGFPENKTFLSLTFLIKKYVNELYINYSQ